MQTETTIETRTVDRVATIALLRVVDFEKSIAEAGGAMSLEAFRAAGDFVVVVSPNGRGAAQTRHGVSGLGEGSAFLNGFEMCANLKKKGPRKEKTPKAPTDPGAPAKPKKSSAK